MPPTSQQERPRETKGSRDRSPSSGNSSTADGQPRTVTTQAITPRPRARWRAGSQASSVRSPGQSGTSCGGVSQRIRGSPTPDSSLPSTLCPQQLAPIISRVGEVWSPRPRKRPPVRGNCACRRQQVPEQEGASQVNANSTVAVVVDSGGEQVVAHVGLHALGSLADRLGLGALLSARVPQPGFGSMIEGKVLTQAMLMLHAGGERARTSSGSAAQPRACSGRAVGRDDVSHDPLDRRARVRECLEDNGRGRAQVWPLRRPRLRKAPSS